MNYAYKSLFLLSLVFFAAGCQTESADSPDGDPLHEGNACYGIAKTAMLDVADNTVITQPEQEKIISLWEEELRLTPALLDDGRIKSITVSPFTYGGRISVPQFTVQLAAAGDSWRLSQKSDVITVTPIFFSGEESSNGQADEKTNQSLNCVVDRFSFTPDGEQFSADFRLNFINQNLTAKKSRASDVRVEANFMAVAVTVTGGTDRAYGSLQNKTEYSAITPLSVSGSVIASPRLSYTVLKEGGAVSIRMSAFSYSPKMRIGDIYMTAPIDETGCITSAASKEKPLYTYTANDEKIMPIKITALQGTFNERTQSLAFSFMPGSMPLAISVAIDSFEECTARVAEGGL
ncbi:MAG: hypothetical protein K6G80_05425 [Treponema sp.]|nr:hypothetical protein [Treponema sp.]